MDISSIRALNASARRVHGADISIQIARAIAWGNDDTLILIHGDKHSEAAADIARAAIRTGNKPTIKEEPGSSFMGSSARPFSIVQFS